MYRILLRLNEPGNFESTYRFANTETDGIATPFETDDESQVDEFVSRLCHLGWSVSQIIVIKTTDYFVSLQNVE